MPQNIKNSLNRREFLSFLTLGWAAFTAAVGGLASLAFRFSYPNVNFDPEMEFNAGYPLSMKMESTSAGKMVLVSGLLRKREDFLLYQIFVLILAVSRTGSQLN